MARFFRRQRACSPGLRNPPLCRLADTPFLLRGLHHAVLAIPGFHPRLRADGLSLEGDVGNHPGVRPRGPTPHRDVFRRTLNDRARSCVKCHPEERVNVLFFTLAQGGSRGIEAQIRVVWRSIPRLPPWAEVEEDKFPRSLNDTWRVIAHGHFRLRTAKRSTTRSPRLWQSSSRQTASEFAVNPPLNCSAIRDTVANSVRQGPPALRRWCD